MLSPDFRFIATATDVEASHAPKKLNSGAWRCHPSPMTILPALQAGPALADPLPSPISFLLRLEGLAIGAVSVLLYARTGASWWLFAALWLAPDLSILGYLAGPCRGSRIYNAAHTYTIPMTLAVCALLLHANVLLPFALIWVNHIAIDRIMGYGLKFSNGFDWTHLGLRKRRFGKINHA